MNKYNTIRQRCIVLALDLLSTKKIIQGVHKSEDLIKLPEYMIFSDDLFAEGYFKGRDFDTLYGVPGQYISELCDGYHIFLIAGRMGWIL
jgi:hypothetical protein